MILWQMKKEKKKKKSQAWYPREYKVHIKLCMWVNVSVYISFMFTLFQMISRHCATFDRSSTFFLLESKFNARAHFLIILINNNNNNSRSDCKWHRFSRVQLHVSLESAFHSIYLLLWSAHKSICHQNTRETFFSPHKCKHQVTQMRWERKKVNSSENKPVLTFESNNCISIVVMVRFVCFALIYLQLYVDVNNTHTYKLYRKVCKNNQHNTWINSFYHEPGKMVNLTSFFIHTWSLHHLKYKSNVNFSFWLLDCLQRATDIHDSYTIQCITNHLSYSASHL